MARAVVVLQLWVLLTALQALWVTAAWLVARSLGLGPRRAQVGYGPSVELPGTSVRVGLLPVGAWLQSGDPEAPDPHAGVPVSRRWAAAGLPWALVWLGTAALVGPDDAIRHLGAGLALLADPGALWPGLRRLGALLHDGAWAHAAGAVGGRLVAWNLLPLPTLAGGALYQAPLQVHAPAWAARVAGVGAALTSVLALVWLAAGLRAYG